MNPIDPEHHDGTSDATPGGEAGRRRPGERAFAVFLALASAYLLWDAYGISGFDKLSSPGSIPMATTAVMLVSAVLIAIKTWRLPNNTAESIRRDIFPPIVAVFVALLIGVGLFLSDLGFLPTAGLFLLVAIKFLGRRSWVWTAGVSLGSLLLIWLIFRIVFTVLMPAGLVPEAEVIQWFRNVFSGGA